MHDISTNRWSLIRPILLTYIVSGAIAITLFILAPYLTGAKISQLENVAGKTSGLAPYIFLALSVLAAAIIMRSEKYGRWVGLGIALLGFVAQHQLLAINGSVLLAVSGFWSLILYMLLAGPRYAFVVGLLATTSFYLNLHYFSEGIDAHKVDVRVFAMMLALLWPLSTLIQARSFDQRLASRGVKQLLLSATVVFFGYYWVDPVWELNVLITCAISLGFWLMVRSSAELATWHRISINVVFLGGYLFNVHFVDGLTLYVVAGYMLLAYLTLSTVAASLVCAVYLALAAVNLELTDGMVLRGLVSGFIFALFINLWLSRLQRFSKTTKQTKRRTPRRNLGIALTVAGAVLLVSALPPILGWISYSSSDSLFEAVVLELFLSGIIFWIILELMRHIEQEQNKSLESISNLQRALAANEALVTQLEKQKRETELALAVGKISVFELDCESQVAQVLSGHHPSFETGSSFNFLEMSQRVIPSEREREALQQAMQRDNAEVEYRVIYPGETTPQWARLCTGKHYFSEGRKKNLVLRFDVTKEYESLNAMREAQERQREMFAVVGHELRTPVAAIDMLLRDEDLTPEQKNETISDIAQNLLNVLEDMRTVVAPERAKFTQESAASPAEVVKRALSPLNPLAQQLGLQLNLTLPNQRLESYYFNEQALRQIATNLTKNALLHSSGSKVWVTLGISRLSNTEETLELSIEDNGKGIPEDQIERLFTAFARGDTDQGGTGLGLFIASELAETLGGELAYRQSVQGGACFTLLMPVKQIEEKAGEVPTSDLTVTLDGMRILLAEDEPMLRMLTEKVLGKKGASVKSFENGRLALEAFDESSFDLVLTDLMMPEMDGLQLTRSLRERGVKLPIIGVTAAVVGEETDQLLAAGANGFISKPINVERILQLLAEIAPHRDV